VIATRAAAARLALLFWAMLALSGMARAEGPDDSGRFVEIRDIAAPGLPPQRVTIWLPPGYDASDRRYGTVYMHDAQNLFDPALSGYGKVWAADKAMLRLMAAGKIEPRIIVGIWHPPGQDRYRQYLPQAIHDAAPAPLRAEMDRLAGGPIMSDAYLTFLADQLKPMIDRDYRTLADPAHTAIAGSSMGGLMSCYAFAQRPDIFGQAGCISSHWPLGDPANIGPTNAEVIALWTDYLRAHLGAPAGRRLWMDHGTETLDAAYGDYQAAIDAKAAELGWVTGHDVESRIYPGAAHEENAWAARLDTIFAWLLSS